MSLLANFIDDEIMAVLNVKLNEAINGMTSPTRERIRKFIFNSKGKQLRPALIAVTTKILVDNVDYREEAMERSYNAAIAIELLHNMTLIHDDLIDRAPLRRGRKAFHIVHGTDRALHDGDILHAYALTLLKEEPTLDLVLDYSYQVSLGNAIELEDRLDQNFGFDLDHVIRIMELKTAIVFAGCVKLGCFAGRREDLFTERVHDAIVAAGIAFQIQDDFLDIQGDQEQFGKIAYWDIQESKRNLFLYFALQTDHAELVKEIYNKPVGEKTDEEVREILKIFRGASPQVQEVRNKYLEFSLRELATIQDNLDPEDTAAQELFDFLQILVRILVEREK
ncbi:MAG: polyprenyl synthetase family protein [Candidatus Heimdallarchaeota archaeon]